MTSDNDNDVIHATGKLDRVLILSCSFVGKNSTEGALADAIIDGLHDMRAAVDKGVDVSS